MRRFGKAIVAVAAIGIVGAVSTACSSSGGSGAKPIADVTSLSGQSTSVKLDPAVRRRADPAEGDARSDR